MKSLVASVCACASLALAALSCGDMPTTTATIENRYPTSATQPFVVYRALWQSVYFEDPIAPGTSSDPQNALAASETAAYVVLAPGWDPTSATSPTSFIILESRNDYALHFDTTLHIAVDDDTFVGNCLVGSILSQNAADFIVQHIFAADLSNVHYDAATCTTTFVGDAGAP